MNNTMKNSMKTVSVSKRIAAPAQVAWSIVRTGAEMHRWVPAITECRLEGEGVGAKRICVLAGQEIEETIATVDDDTRVFQYRIHRQSMMPVTGILGTIHVTELGPAEAEVLWFVNFELLDCAAWGSVKQGIEDIYTSGIDGLAARVAAIS